MGKMTKAFWNSKYIEGRVPVKTDFMEKWEGETSLPRGIVYTIQKRKSDLFPIKEAEKSKGRGVIFATGGTK